MEAIIMWFGGMKTVIYNHKQHHQLLLNFFSECDVENSVDMNSLGFEKRQNPMMVLVLSDQKIVSLCYVHDFSDYYPDSYRAFCRTTTLTEFRSRGVVRQKSCASAAGVMAHSCPLQVDYAHANEAKHVLFTTNNEKGMSSSRRLDQFLRKIEPIDPRFSFFDEAEIYGVRQTVWRLNFRDIVNMRDPI